MDRGRNKDYRATGAILDLPYFLALKAEALHLADRTSEALEAIREAEALAERSEERWWCAELHRLRAVFLAAIGADEAQIEASFCASHQNRKGAEVDFARETRRSNLRGIPSPKSERVRRTWIPTASLLMPKRGNAQNPKTLGRPKAYPTYIAGWPSPIIGSWTSRRSR